MPRCVSVPLLFLMAFLLASCGTSFNKPWQTALAAPVPKDSIEGPWQGYWKSAVSGHHGNLRCIVGPEQNGQRDFYYHAVWGKVFRGAFESRHEVARQKNGETKFTARRNIEQHGFFRAEGTITPSEFTATYNAAGDHGVFELKRPK